MVWPVSRGLGGHQRARCCKLCFSNCSSLPNPFNCICYDLVLVVTYSPLGKRSRFSHQSVFNSDSWGRGRALLYLASTGMCHPTRYGSQGLEPQRGYTSLFGVLNRVSFWTGSLEQGLKLALCGLYCVIPTIIFKKIQVYY